MGARSLEGLDAIKSEIETAGETWRRIIESPEVNLSVSIRRMQSSVPLASAIITDKAVIATPYMLTRPTDDSPTLSAAANTVFHRVMQQEFDQAWSEAASFARVEPRPEPKPQQPPANANVAQPADRSSAPGSSGLGSPGLGLGNLSSMRGMGPGKR